MPIELILRITASMNVSLCTFALALSGDYAAKGSQGHFFYKDPIKEDPSLQWARVGDSWPIEVISYLVTPFVMALSGDYSAQGCQGRSFYKDPIKEDPSLQWARVGDMLGLMRSWSCLVQHKENPAW